MTDKKISVSYFKDQQYDALKKAAVSSGNLFVDPEFPAQPRSLVRNMPPLPNFGWKRPGEICEDPHLFVEGAEAADIHQGKLGSCWFVGACSCLALYKEILYQVVPDHKEQEWDPENPSSYGGIFRFHIWHYGEWMEVVVDDLLPVMDDELLFIHSQSKNEFWSALLEKAYAKLLGNYEAMDGGEVDEALVDFTGGVAETYDLQTMDLCPMDMQKFFERLQTDMELKSLMVVSIPPKSKAELEAVTKVGLVIGHAYGITAVRAMLLAGTELRQHFDTDKLLMIRLRNPWGKCEWKGAFSNGSPEWHKISTTEQEKLGLDFENDGEFWMTFEDFLKHFVHLVVCRMVDSLRKMYHEVVFHGEWKPGMAGGCWNHRKTCLMNPQYIFDINIDEDEIMVDLTQKSTLNTAMGSTNESIGFVILRCELNRKTRVHTPACFTKMSAVVFVNSRSNVQRVRLEKGKYVLVPSTFDPGKRLQYLLRIYTSSPSDFKPMMEDEYDMEKMGCCCPKATLPQLVTQIKVMSVEDLEEENVIGSPNLYCVVLCEKQKVTTHAVPNQLNPTWDTWFLLYRWNPDQPIKIQLWNHSPPKDQHVGEYTMSFSGSCDANCWECPIYRQNSKILVPGNLMLHVAQSESLDGI